MKTEIPRYLYEGFSMEAYEKFLKRRYWKVTNRLQRAIYRAIRGCPKVNNAATIARVQRICQHAYKLGWVDLNKFG